MRWNCEQVEDRLSDYVDGLLNTEEQRAFTDHAGSCARCGPLLTQVSGYVVQLRRLPLVEEPPRLVYQILDRTLGPRKEAKGWRAVLEWLRPVAQPRFAMGVVTTLLAVLMLSQAFGIQWSRVEWADLQPANLYRVANSRAHLLYARGVKFVNDLRVVYEIQTRLQTPQETPAAEPQKAPGSTETEPKNHERDLNRANELKPTMLLASAIGGVPGRSLR